MAEDLLDTFNFSECQIKLIFHIEDISLDVETVISIGLIINELITNTLKYDFPDHTAGQIEITLKEIDKQLLLKIKDNGNGLNENQMNGKEDSFGHKLIEAFQEKLDGTLKIDGSNGTSVEMSFAKYIKV